MSAEEQHDPVGQTLGKKFFVRRVIGVGGMGVVYEVEHVVTKKCGALKLLHASLAAQPRTVERFVREASAAARIKNPHIVETYDAGELPSGEPYMFMELLTGSSVRDLLLARGRLRFVEAREILVQAADGLAAAHAVGIVHRDIKPENLFVVNGEPAYVKILDFGISKFSVHTDHRLTSDGAPMGTPYYMSPEQVAGRSNLDERSDVYALGVVLYECVTGSVPFDAATLPALSIKIFEGRYAPPSTGQTDTPAGLDDVVARAMAVEPSARFANMRDFQAALEALEAVGAPEVTFSATLANAAETPAVPGATPSGRSSALAEANATPEPKAPARGRVGLAVAIGVGMAAIASAGVVWNVVTSPGVAPDDARVPSAERAQPKASHPPPVARAEASAAPVASETTKPVVSAPARRSPTPKPSTSTPSRAARDGLSEDNPFGE